MVRANGLFTSRDGNSEEYLWNKGLPRGQGKDLALGETFTFEGHHQGGLPVKSQHLWLGLLDRVGFFS